MFYSSSRHWKKTNLLAILSSVQLPSSASSSIANLPSYENNRLTVFYIVLIVFSLHYVMPPNWSHLQKTLNGSIEQVCHQMDH